MDTEYEDAKKVDTAKSCIDRRLYDAAETLLADVVSRTPADYVNQVRRDGALAIKFWSMADFMEYVGQEVRKGAAEGIQWLPNAYPRAHFFLGWIAIERGNLERAADWFSRARSLEPDNPLILCELGQTYLGQKRLDDARRVFAQAITDTCRPSDAQKAVAHRGLGYICIERLELDRAERHYRHSLEIAGPSATALNQLAFIEVLRNHPKGQAGQPQPEPAVRPPGATSVRMPLPSAPVSLGQAQMLYDQLESLQVQAPADMDTLNARNWDLLLTIITEWCEQKLRDYKTRGGSAPRSLVAEMPHVTQLLRRCLDRRMGPAVRSRIQALLMDFARAGIRI